eukprot:2641797-Prymnesium_polylepis.1
MGRFGRVREERRVHARDVHRGVQNVHAAASGPLARRADRSALLLQWCGARGSGAPTAAARSHHGRRAAPAGGSAPADARRPRAGARRRGLQHAAAAAAAPSPRGGVPTRDALAAAIGQLLSTPADRRTGREGREHFDRTTARRDRPGVVGSGVRGQEQVSLERLIAPVAVWRVQTGMLVHVYAAACATESGKAAVGVSPV